MYNVSEYTNKICWMAIPDDSIYYIPALHALQTHFRMMATGGDICQRALFTFPVLRDNK